MADPVDQIDQQQQQQQEMSAEDKAALARGDIFQAEPQVKVDLSEFNPDFLKTIAGVETGTVQDKKEDEPFIPKARLDELSQQVKTSREENAQLREQLESLKSGKQVEEIHLEQVDYRQQLKGLREQHRSAMLEGDLDTCDTLEDQMDTLRIQIAKDEINGELNQSKVASTLQEVANKAYKLYPFLDEKSDQADPDAILAVITRRDQLAKSGKSLTEALQAAIDEKGPRFAKLNGIDVLPVVKTDERDAEALKRAADASLRQPATLSGRVDKESFQLDISKMTDKQILAMPEEMRAKARGDIL